MRPICTVSTLLAASACAMAAPAQAELINATSPETIASLILLEGMPAELNQPTIGAPYIRSQHHSLTYLIFFNNCDAQNTNCKSVQFYLGYNDAPSATLAKINEWNQDHRFGRAYLDDEGDPVIEMDLDLDFNGIPRENIVQSVKIWQSLMDQFQTYLFG